MKELTYDKAHRLFRYDPETGRLFWKVSLNRRIRPGDEAGAMQRIGRTQYCYVGVSGKLYLAHRIVWLMRYGEWPENEIDHIDGDGLNNRIENLRDVTKSVNMRNLRMSRNNSSGVNGVYWHNGARKWYAQSGDGSGRQKYLGLYNDLADAEQAVREFHESRGFTERHGGAR